jgi:hypothetical protein
LCHNCSSFAPGSQQTTMTAWCCAEPLCPATSSVRRTGSKECSTHASIDAERKEEQLDGATHHHPPVGVSSALTPTFLSSVPIALVRRTATRSDQICCTRTDRARAAIVVPLSWPQRHGRNRYREKTPIFAQIRRNRATPPHERAVGLCALCLWPG